MLTRLYGVNLLGVFIMFLSFPPGGPSLPPSPPHSNPSNPPSPSPSTPSARGTSPPLSPSRGRRAPGDFSQPSYGPAVAASQPPSLIGYNHQMGWQPPHAFHQQHGVGQHDQFAFQEQFEFLHQQHGALQRDHAILQEQYKAFQQYHATLEKHLQDRTKFYESERTALQLKITSLNQQVKDAQETSQSAIEKLTREKSDLQEHLQALTKSHRSEMTALQLENTALSQQVKDAQETSEKLIREKSDFQEQLNKSQHNKSQQKIEELQSVNDTEDMLAYLNFQEGRHQSNIESLLVDHDNFSPLETENDELKQSYDVLQLETENDELKQSYDVLQQKAQAVQVQNVGLQERVADLENELQKARALLEERAQKVEGCAILGPDRSLDQIGSPSVSQQSLGQFQILTKCDRIQH